MKSKAQTLANVANKLSKFRVPEIDFFTVEAWRLDRDELLSQLKIRFGTMLVAVRSSAFGEDGEFQSQAGAYDSFLDVPADNPKKLAAAIDQVVESYTHDGNGTLNDEVIVQRMVGQTVMSGVIFTHDLNTGAPYYVINYDDVSGMTNTVTSGGGEYSNRTIYIHRSASKVLRSPRFQALIDAVQELEHSVGSQFLDIEFAIGEDLTPYLLQVRLITTQPNWNRAVSQRIDSALLGIQTFVGDRLQPMMGVFGRTTVLGQMPDWNPAEMIGRAPRALAYSLYKTLITDDAWRIARAVMGYSVPRGQPLMVSLAGQPFIDTRLSFHSFIPRDVPSDISKKLVDVWVKRLQEYPVLHDKVEFEVAITTYSFDIDEKIETLIGPVLTKEEKSVFKEALFKQARLLLSDIGDEGISESLSKVKELVRSQNLARYSLIGQEDVSVLFEMIDNCIHLGTVPFSILARHGFIAKTILLSIQSRGIITMEEVQTLQSEIRTVASELVDDMRRLQNGELPFTAFMEEYGHLRPGTYDILSQRYDQMPDFGLTDSNVGASHEQNEFVLSAQQRHEIDQLLRDEGFLELDAEKLFDYIQAATIGREYSKFVFTRSVSDMLELIARFGEKHGLSRDEMSHVSIKKLLDVVSKSSDGSIEERLRQIAEDEAEKHAICAAIRLPQVLFDEAGVHIVPFQVCHPNFITQKKITARCVRLIVGQTPPSLVGKIVLIENADPGFDWIFAQKISGLITKYGGANSHMAIRCAEFGIPAAIGCGEQRFEVFIKVDQILLDCAAGLINPLH